MRGMVCIAAVTAGLVVAAAYAVASPSPTPRKCVSPEPKRLVVAFIGAFDQGRMPRLDTIFSPASTFKWYSSGGPSGRLAPDAYERSTLLPYFADRHAWGEHLKLTSYRGHGNSNGYAHFEFQLVREARDVVPSTYYGKGAIICSNRGNKIAVWSMAPS